MRLAFPNGRRAHRLVKYKRENGVAILLALGILSLVLMMAMSYAYTSRTTYQLADNGSSLASARMIANAGVQRALATLEKDISGQISPAQLFYSEPSEVGPRGQWFDRPYIASINQDTVAGATAGVDSALNVSFNGVNFTPESGLHSDVGWVYLESARDGSSTGDGTMLTNKVVGRMAWIILDETGKVDPSVIVDTGVYAEIDLVRTGASMSELNLSRAVDSTTIAAFFQTNGLGSGQMPNGKRWLSHHHMYYGNSGAIASQDNADTVAKICFPYSIEDNNSIYWVDQDLDGEIDYNDKELRQRMDVTEIGSTITASDLYDAFVGYDVTNHSTRDDLSYFCTWLQSLSGYSKPELRRIAAQVAANMVDYADRDSDADGNGLPGEHYIGAAGTNYQLHSGDPGASSYEYRIYGTEDNYQLGEVLATMYYERSGADFKFQTQFNVEVFHPFSSNARFNGTVDVSYEIQIVAKAAAVVTPTSSSVASGGGTYTSTFTETVTITPNQYTTGANGRMRARSSMVAGATNGFTSVFTADPDSLTLNYFRITAVEVQDSGGTTIDYLPEKSGASWISQYTPTADTITMGSASPNYLYGYSYTQFEAKDPTLNGLHQADSRFSDYFNVSSGQDITLAGKGSIGTALDVDLNESWFLAYASPPDPLGKTAYGETSVANSAFTTRLDLGRVSGWYRGQSLRFWTMPQQTADQANHDGYLLDMFQGAPDVRGKININGRYQSVFNMLFGKIAPETPLSDYSQYNGGNRVRQLNGTTGGAPFYGIGGFGGVLDIIPERRPRDYDAEEEHLSQFVEQMTVGQNYFTIIVCAQTLRDVGVWATLPDPDPGWIHWKTDSGDKHYAALLAEQKVMAAVSRDVFTNTFSVMRLEYLDD